MSARGVYASRAFRRVVGDCRLGVWLAAMAFEWRFSFLSWLFRKMCLAFFHSTDARSPCRGDLQLLDDATTVDPSYTISLIRQLLPQGSNVEKEFR